MSIFYEYDLDPRFARYVIMHVPNWVKVYLKFSKLLWFVSGAWLMFADTLNLVSLKGFINESFSSCSSVKIAHMHMDVNVCSKVRHHSQLLRRPGNFGTMHTPFMGTWFKIMYFFLFRHMGESWPVEESRETFGLEQWIRRILILVKGKQEWQYVWIIAFSSCLLL